MNTIPNIHPGDVLLEEFLEPHAISRNKLAREIRVPPNRISEIVQGKRSISADTALRLARYFDTTPDFWINLQSQFDLEAAVADISDELSRIQPFRRAKVVS